MLENSIVRDLKRLNLISGKGGVGRTTLAATLASASAAAGKRTLLVELEDESGWDSPLARMFGLSHFQIEPHEIEKNLDLLRLLNPVLEWGTESKSLLATTKKIPTKDKVVAFSLASPWATKEWDLEEASELMKKLINEGTEVYLLGDKSFLERSLLLEKKLNSRLLKNFTAKTTFTEWVDLIAQSDLLISGDSAAVHIASDLGVPVIALFGPTVPEFGFTPLSANSRIIQTAEKLDCRPCGLHGHRACPKGHFKCASAIQSNQLVDFMSLV